MDAKPQRPRTLRVRDENALPAFLQTGKTLHHRTKSVPSIAILASMDAKQTKPVLGVKDRNKAVKIAVKDDLSVGLTSPDKVKAGKVIAEIANTFIPKSFLPSVPEVHSTTALVPLANALRDIAPNVPSAPVTRSAKVIAAPAPVHNPEMPLVAITQVQNSQVDEAVSHNTELPVSVSASVPSNKPAEPHKENIDPQLCEPMSLPMPEITAPTPPLVDAVAANSQYYQQAASLVPIDIGYGSAHLLDSSPDLEIEEDYTAARSWGLLATDATLTTLFDPKYNDKINEEIALAKAYVDEARTPADIEDDFLDTSMVAEYSDEIFDYFRDLELSMRPDPFYMVRQVELGWSMRAVLIDWIVQVHARFNLLPETLFLTVNYIDRFLTEKVVSIGKLQLVGATAIFLAAKYEEVNCPTLSEIVYMVENGYTGDEILKAERFMLTQLNFRLGWPGPMSFLRRISKADDYDLETRTLAKYLLEVCIMDERFLGLTPSFLAAGAHCLARFMLRKGDWTPAHVYYSNYTFNQLKSLLRGIVECLEVPRRHHEAVYVKYADRRFKRASTYVENEMANGFRLPFMRA